MPLAFLWEMWYYFFVIAGVMELVDVADSKSAGLIPRVGSSPTTGTMASGLIAFERCCKTTRFGTTKTKKPQRAKWLFAASYSDQIYGDILIAIKEELIKACIFLPSYYRFYKGWCRRPGLLLQHSATLFKCSIMGEISTKVKPRIICAASEKVPRYPQWSAYCRSKRTHG